MKNLNALMNAIVSDDRIFYLFVPGSYLDKLSQSEIHLHKNVLPCFTHTGERETQILNDRERG